MEKEIEVWKDVLGYEGLYKVSNFGNVMSNKTNKILCNSINTNGYIRLSLCKNGFVKKHYLHQIVFYSFSRFTKSKKFVVDHKDNIKTNNLYKNLQLITQRKNVSKDNKNKYSLFNCVYKLNNKWHLRLKRKNKNLYFGSFEYEQDAIKLYFIVIDKIEKNKDISSLVKKRFVPKYKGVTFDVSSNKWRATIYINKKAKNLGRFNTEERANQEILKFNNQ